MTRENIIAQIAPLMLLFRPSASLQGGSRSEHSLREIKIGFITTDHRLTLEWLCSCGQTCCQLHSGRGLSSNRVLVNLKWSRIYGIKSGEEEDDNDEGSCDKYRQVFVVVADSLINWS